MKISVSAMRWQLVALEHATNAADNETTKADLLGIEEFLSAVVAEFDAKADRDNPVVVIQRTDKAD